MPEILFSHKGIFTFLLFLVLISNPMPNYCMIIYYLPFRHQQNSTPLDSVKTDKLFAIELSCFDCGNLQSDEAMEILHERSVWGYMSEMEKRT